MNSLFSLTIDEYIGRFSATRNQLVDAYLASLATYEGHNVYNPWRDYDPRYDISEEAAKWRLDNLKAYLLPRLGRASHIIVAEAAGYQGCRFTGIPITCERMLLGFHNVVDPTMISPSTLYRTSHPTSMYIDKAIQRDKGFNEPTDTVVWKGIVENHLDPYDVLLWNMFPFHPHKVEQALSNRTPTSQELQCGWQYVKDLLALHERLRYEQGALLSDTEYDTHGMTGTNCAVHPRKTNNDKERILPDTHAISTEHRMLSPVIKHYDGENLASTGRMINGEKTSESSDALGKKSEAPRVSDLHIYGVGQKSADILAQFGVTAIALRHPANGGARLYQEGFARAVAAYRNESV
ncbi:uracil-DNA glycosylase [Veillonella montpellierensis]|uniref:uracil-DNA glycosylase n=1 Tax=Veillonella montpellierensis TaxID=187328 RepID=UPI00068F5527|nr:uracil-DNA glycosylase [Veillonella montpellierensis]